MHRITASLIASCFLFTMTSHAALVITLSDEGGTTFANEFDARNGSPLRLGIYLQQTNPDTILSTEGLVSWGLDLSQSPNDLGVISNAAASAAFDSELHNIVNSTGFEWEYFQSASTGIVGDAILLGAFDFTPSTDGTTLFSISDRLPGTGFENASWYTPTATELDQAIFGSSAANSFTFAVHSVASVPEPSCFALLGCVAAISTMRRPRKIAT